MRKPRDFDAELKALENKARVLKSRKLQQLGELVISTGADALSADELAGALIVLAETKDAGKREAWAKRGAALVPSSPLCIKLSDLRSKIWQRRRVVRSVPDKAAASDGPSASLKHCKRRSVWGHCGSSSSASQSLLGSQANGKNG